ncbi:MAG: hypothetical protein COA99_09060 [Moraxellaceae bacterium]|nr:MAG: hypothetical protein COA99_09060 [Moraxellaceae bacterium]
MTGNITSEIDVDQSELVGTEPVSVKQPEVSYRQWRGLFLDIQQEHDFKPLTIEGDLPADISGIFYQNGPGLFSAQGTQYGHLFDGDGLIRSIRIKDGKAQGAVKLVQSTGLQEERQAGKILFSGLGTAVVADTRVGRWKSILTMLRKGMKGEFAGKNLANTSVLIWQNRLLALLEATKPTEMNPDTLDTIGETSLGKAVQGAFSAHPHWVSERQTGFNFGVNQRGADTFLDVVELPKNGPCKAFTSIKLDRRPVVMVHDNIATANHLVFFIPPVHFPLKNLWNIIKGSAILPQFEWKESLGTEVIIIPIDDPTKVTRFKTKPFFCTHFANAYEENGKLIVDYVHSPDLFVFDYIGSSHMGYSKKFHQDVFDKMKPETLVLRRATIDVDRKDIQFRTLSNKVCEFPKINPSLQGSRYNYTYMLHQLDTFEPTGYTLTHLLKLNVQTGESTIVGLGSEQFPSEPVFIRKKNAKSEDEGYLLTITYDGNKHLSYLAVLDAQHLKQGPIAKIHFGQALPIGFHGAWRPL